MLDRTEGFHTQADEAALLLKRLLQKIEDMSDRERETSARMKILKMSYQAPGRMADATLALRTTTTMPTAEASDPPIHTTPKPRPSLTHPFYVQRRQTTMARMEARDGRQD
jgi:hypothetical protein